MNSLSVPKSQFPSVDSPQRLGGKVKEPGRAKVPLKPGRSLMDWVRLGQKSGGVLNGLNGRRVAEVTTDELATHNKREDAWTALRGRVYNITPYMDFHPGGADELMKAAGIDGTSLFNDIHQWVNFESMLANCFIGRLKNTFSVPTKVAPKSKSKPPSTTVSSTTISTDSGKKADEEKYEGKPRARYDWYQNGKNVIITVYAKCQSLSSNCVVIDRKNQDFKVNIHLDDFIYCLHIDLSEPVTSEYKIQVRKSSVYRLEMVLIKAEPDKYWSCLGTHLEGHGSLTETKDKELNFRPCMVKNVETVTHDTRLLTFELPEGSWMQPPIGYHVYLKSKINGLDVNRPYTVVQSTIVDEPKISNQIHLMIKIYKDGQLTPTIEALKEGDTIEISDYEGSFILSKLHHCQELVLLAAGSGFTPMVRLINHGLASDSNRKVNLFFFNKTENDIMWRQQLEDLMQKDKRLHVTHILSGADKAWNGLTGRIRIEILEEFMKIPPESSKDRLICICGPTHFTSAAFSIVKEFGYTMESIHLFTA